MNARDAVKWARGSRALRRIAALLVAYLVLGWVFAFATRSRGLLAPGGSPHLDMVALGVVYLVARFAVRFGLPGLVAYLIAVRVIDRLRGSLTGG